MVLLSLLRVCRRQPAGGSQTGPLLKKETSGGRRVPLRHEQLARWMRYLLRELGLRGGAKTIRRGGSHWRMGGRWRGRSPGTGSAQKKERIDGCVDAYALYLFAPSCETNALLLEGYT
jgi:hypothetical protein